MAHITELEFQQMRDGTLLGAAYFEALRHIGECDSCATRLAEQVEEQPLLKAPMSVRAGVKKKLREPDGDALKSYRIYRRQVLLAMCATLILVFSGVFAQFGNIPVDKISQANISITEKIKDGFSVFSQKLWIMGDHTNEQSKK